MKGEKIEQVVSEMYEKRMEEIRKRKVVAPKLKLFSPIKKRAILREKDTYDWTEEDPYDADHAIEALDQSAVLDED